jgi:hypothetical protein
MPVIGLAGNMTLMFAALSYSGRLSLMVHADRAAYPDLDVLVAGVERACAPAWHCSPLTTGAACATTWSRGCG